MSRSRLQLSSLPQRMMIDYQPVLESALERAFRARGLDWRGSWYLLEMAIDPGHQGKGASSPCATTL